MILRVKIDVTKIDKAALFKGDKGTYLDVAILLKDSPDQYGNDGMVTQDIGKDRRLSGERGAILGNARWVAERPSTQSTPARQERPRDEFDEPTAPGKDDIPW